MLADRDEDILNETTIADRLLYRDGLMLILDKPAGIPVHRGPKGGANLEALFGGLRFGLPRAPAWRTGSTATPRAAWSSAATARRSRSSASSSSRARSPRPTGPSSKACRRPTRGSSTCRSAAATPPAAGG